MPSLTEWKVPPAYQPRVGDYSFDLDRVLSSVIGLHSIIPGDAFSADTLGTERAGNGVLIDDGLVLTIGYLITEKDAFTALGTYFAGAKATGDKSSSGGAGSG